MLYLFIVFFFSLYVICELCKYESISKDLKNKKKIRTYRLDVLYVKLVLLVIVTVLLMLNRFVPSGIVEQSNSLGSSIVFVGVLLILFLGSVWDIKKAKKVVNEK